MRSSGIGGQAVIEGVMMKNKDKYAIAVRKPDNNIEVDIREYVALGERYPVLGIPIIRGVVSFFESLVIGMKTLTYSASFYDEGEEKKTDAGKAKSDSKSVKAGSKDAKKKQGQQAAKKQEAAADNKKSDWKQSLVMACTVIFSVIIAVAVFMILPFFVTQLLVKVISSQTILALIEGCIRVILFVSYVAIISRLKDIKRVFMYHGAEHKSINCIERGYDLTVENVRKQSRQHKRCGTSFMLVVMFISIVFFIFIRVDNTWLRVLIRLLLVPVIAGVSYEFIKWAGRSDTVLVNILSKPGMWLQGMTTKEPDDSMIEVAIESVNAIYDWRPYVKEFREEKQRLRSKKRENRQGKKENDNLDSKLVDIEEQLKQHTKSSKREDLENQSEQPVEPAKSVRMEEAQSEQPVEPAKSIRMEEAQSEQPVEPAKSVRMEEAQSEQPVEPVKSDKNERQRFASIKGDSNKRQRSASTKSAKTDKLYAEPVKDEDDEEEDEVLRALDKYFVDRKPTKDDEDK